MPTLTTLLLALALTAPPDSLPPDWGPPDSDSIVGAYAFPPSCPGGQTIGQDEIDASGAVRLAGLLRLLDAPRRHTTHGFLWPTLFDEGLPGGSSETALVMDGEPLAPDLLGFGDLERLPADVPDLTRVTFCPGPQLVDGRLWSGGALFLESRPEPGVRGAVFIGNEVGDPGPFRYLIGNANIDKFGPDYSGAAVWRDRRTQAVGLEARFKIRRFYATDPEILTRTAAATGDFPRLRLLAGETRGRYVALGGTHRVSAMASGGNVLSFMPSLGQEVPAQPIWAQAAASGTVPLRPGLGLAYRVRGAHEQVRSRNAAFPSDLDWTAQTGHGRIELRSSWRGARLVGGLSGEQAWVDGDEGDEVLEGFTLGRLYLMAQRGPSGAAGHVALGPSGAGAAATGWRAWQTAGTEFVATLAASRTLPEERLGLAYWQHQGLTGFSLPSVERDVRAFGDQREALFRLDASRPLGSARLSATLGIRGLESDTDQARFSPLDTLGLPTRGGTAYHVRASGTVGHVGIAAEETRGIARLRLFVDARGALSGKASFQEAWRTVPAVRGGGRLSLRPAPSFSAFASLELASGTRWATYSDGERDSLPPVALLDAAFQKTLWKGRLRTSLLFRNLLSAPERYQPRGVALDLRLYARAVLHLP